MTNYIEEDEDGTLEDHSRCKRMRGFFLRITMSAVVPMLIFMPLLLMVSMGDMSDDMELKTSRIAVIICSILYIQLIAAIFLLIMTFSMRNVPIKFHICYAVIHMIITIVFLCLCSLMTAFNNYSLVSVLFFCGNVMYVFTIIKSFQNKRLLGLKVNLF